MLGCRSSFVALVPPVAEALDPNALRPDFSSITV